MTVAPRGLVHLRALQANLRELEGDGSLGRRIRAVQEMAALLEEMPDGDPGVSRLFQGRGAPSLLVSLISTCGEDHALTRNSILSSLAKLSTVLDAEQLLPDPRVWALLMRMCYQQDEESVQYALKCVLSICHLPDVHQRIVASRRVKQLMQQLSLSANLKVAQPASAIASRIEEAQKQQLASQAAADCCAPPSSEINSRVRPGMVAKTEWSFVRRRRTPTMEEASTSVQEGVRDVEEVAEEASDKAEPRPKASRRWRRSSRDPSDAAASEGIASLSSSEAVGDLADHVDESQKVASPTHDERTRPSPLIATRRWRSNSRDLIPQRVLTLPKALDAETEYHGMESVLESPRDATIRDLKTWRGTIEPKLDTSAAKIDQPEARAGWFPRFGLGMRSTAEKSDARALRSADASAEPSLAKSAWPEHDTAATEYDVVEGERAQVHADEDMVPGHSHSHTHVSVREEAGEEVLDATVDDQSHDKDNSTIDDREAGCIQAEAGYVVAEAGCVAAEPGCAEAEVESELERSGDYAASDLDDSMRIGDELADSNDTYPESIAETSWGGGCMSEVFGGLSLSSDGVRAQRSLEVLPTGSGGAHGRSKPDATMTASELRRRRRAARAAADAAAAAVGGAEERGALSKTLPACREMSRPIMSSPMEHMPFPVQSEGGMKCDESPDVPDTPLSFHLETPSPPGKTFDDAGAEHPVQVGGSACAGASINAEERRRQRRRRNKLGVDASQLSNDS
ncbi:hypothetical protein AB1Y20_020581 [Prymnesium parvum]|uniref:Protein HGH1 homolog n=1 Tax=Prymnesium parvum TaxID=97485 RepID=A0AB34JY08_PRYPA